MPKLCKCGAIVESRCLRCYPMPTHNKTTAERGYGNDWRKLSEYKRKIDPLCERCSEQGRTTPACHVHHVVPIKVAPEKRLDITNLMSVCLECHEELEKDAGNKQKRW